MSILETQIQYKNFCPRAKPNMRNGLFTENNMIPDAYFPDYPKYFNSNYLYDRKAGVRVCNRQGLLKFNEPFRAPLCFKGPCSTVFPCNRKYGTPCDCNVNLNTI